LIYAIGMDGDYIKFGYANRPEQRMKELQIGCPKTLELLGAVDIEHKDEIFFHSAFSAVRVRGEWFKREPVVEPVIRLMQDEALNQVQKRVRILDYLAGLLTPRQFAWIESRISDPAQIAYYATEMRVTA
jgi:hypothetical protein